MSTFHSEQINELAAALAKAQGEFPAIPKNRTAHVKHKNGGEHSYVYADLSDVLAFCRPILSKNNLALLQITTALEKHDELETRLIHSSGQFFRSTLHMPSGLDPQELGAWLTYMRRYEIQCLIGVNAEEDSDAQAVRKGQKGASAPAARPPATKTPSAGTDIMKPHATGPITPGGVKLPNVPKLSPDEFILAGKYKASKIIDLPPHVLQEMVTEAEAYFAKSGIDPMNSMTDTARSYRAIKILLSPRMPAREEPGAFNSFTGGLASASGDPQ